ncbi:MAG: metalloregulator ArsR/SmtB family transcription factor [Gemmatimonadota bacterium]|nr:metalloregulator ArsR/SmtB family transcription factor [Gemmatimonadota bacterium]MDH4351741.1 metalloregulator ArsR/SmtB family transcription factor [Gemmatimonadota bacterium]MDH5198242.1 metalloregulator ArsR/SmtB family transcription factor [Gemmatimonadota bacterium]
MMQPTELDIRRAAGLFKVLGHPERIRIAFRLAAGRLTQHELLEDLPWAQSTLARHVGLMRERGLIDATRHGNEVHLRLADDLVPQLLELIHNHPPVLPVGASAPAAAVMGGDYS